MKDPAGRIRKMRKSPRPVSLAVIKYDGPTASCSCGSWSFTHYREKVRENAIDRHLRKRHHGRGIRI